MKRGIRNVAALVASLAVQQQTKAIEAQGGVWAFAQHNRETRRRIAREERREARRAAAQGGK